MYRVKEYNPIYDYKFGYGKGCIFVSNPVSFEDAEKKRIWLSHTQPHLKFVTEKVD